MMTLMEILSLNRGMLIFTGLCTVFSVWGLVRRKEKPRDILWIVSFFLFMIVANVASECIRYNREDSFVAQIILLVGFFVSIVLFMSSIVKPKN